MADTIRTRASLQSLLADNITGDISPQDIRDFLASAVLRHTASGADQIILRPLADSTTFFQILDTDGGTPIVNVDTTNERVGIGVTAPRQILSLKGGEKLEWFNEAIPTAYHTIHAGGTNPFTFFSSWTSTGSNYLYDFQGLYGVSKLIITQDGDVTIGNTAPGARLEIDGLVGTTTGLDIRNLGTATRGIDLSNSNLSGSGDYLLYNGASISWRADGLIDLSGISAGNPIFKLTATSDTPSSDPETDAEQGWIEILIGATPYYVPFYN